jgi:chorismate synthase
MTQPSIRIRDLRSLEDCRVVVDLQEAVWGKDGETVPASVLLVSAKRGGILLGATTDTDELVGFVWSMPGIRDDGIRSHWSHMLAVLPGSREQRVGEQLKWAQRDRALDQQAEVVEWTFDPLQAANAHFNLQVLGGVGAKYGVDVYGALAGPLHRGTPTDRLIVEWWIAQPHVERRHHARHGRVEAAALQARSAEILDAPAAIVSVPEGEWVRVDGVTDDLATRRILVPIPPRFLDMQQQVTGLALEWRLAVRKVMTSAFDRGYRAVDFFLDRQRGGGAYLLARPE